MQWWQYSVGIQCIEHTMTRFYNLPAFWLYLTKLLSSRHPSAVKCPPVLESAHNSVNFFTKPSQFTMCTHTSPTKWHTQCVNSQWWNTTSLWSTDLLTTVYNTVMISCVPNNLPCFWVISLNVPSALNCTNDIEQFSILTAASTTPSLYSCGLVCSGKDRQ